jgi:uncharacterized membrane protein
MPDFEQTLRIHSTADAVYEFIKDVRNMPRYLPTTSKANAEGADRVRVEGDVRGRHYDSSGYLRRVDDRNRIEWGSDEGDYKGWIEARDRDNDQADVTVHLRFDDATWSDEMRDAREADIRSGLSAALKSIQQQLEGTGGKVESPRASDSRRSSR